MFHAGRLPRNIRGAATVGVFMGQAGILQSHEVDKLRHIIKDIKVAMLTTIRGEGQFSSRPMAVTGNEFDGDVYFLTRASSRKVAEIDRDSRVSVSFADPKHERYVSMVGRANLVADRNMVRSLWDPTFKAWFPVGAEDPELAAVRVIVDEAEYWDGPTMIAQIFGVAKGVLTGQDGAMVDHALIALTEHPALP